MKKPPSLGLWKSVDEYTEFALKHGVFGEDAIKLKKQMMKNKIPLPKVTILKNLEAQDV